MLRSARSAVAMSAAALATSLVVAACGGGATPSPSGASAAPSGASAAPSGAASTEPSPGASAAPSSGAASAAPSIDVAGAAQALEDIDSYRMTITSGAGTFEAIVIRQPEPARQITITNDSETTRIVIVGDQAWLDDGSGSYTQVPAAMVGAFTSMFDPLLLVSSAEGWTGGWATVGTEEKNGVQARHLHIDSSTTGALVPDFPSGGSVDIWVADEGYLVAWQATGFGEDVTIDISNVNDPENKVEAPG